MLRDDHEELPYFDETGHEYIREVRRQDQYIKRGGKLSAPQMLKYDNRVSMLVERLMLILEAVREDAVALHDYLLSVEQNREKGLLPEQVYTRFMETIQKQQEETAHRSERERDRLRVIQGGVKQEEPRLSDMEVSDLLEMHRMEKISRDVLFEQLSKRERAGMKLPRMDRNLWGRYRSWVAEKRRARRQPPGL